MEIYVGFGVSCGLLAGLVIALAISCSKNAILQRLVAEQQQQMKTLGRDVDSLRTNIETVREWGNRQADRATQLQRQLKAKAKKA